jgi:hypothetical protein
VAARGLVSRCCEARHAEARENVWLGEVAAAVEESPLTYDGGAAEKP